MAKTESHELRRRHIPALDGIRGLAVLMVFFYHYGGGKQSTHWYVRLIGNTLNFGWAGVSLFFALSGFLITGILWDSFHNNSWWSTFYARRSLRIFPLYYFVLLIAFLSYLHAAPSKSWLAGFAVYAAYLQNVPSFSSLTSSLPTNILLGHLWSLAVEEQFYILWPLLLCLFARKRVLAMYLTASLWTLSFCFRVMVVALHFSTSWALFFVGGRSGELLAGAFVALYLREKSDRVDQQKRRIECIFVASTVSFIMLAAYVVHIHSTVDQSDRIMSAAGLPLLSVASAAFIALCLASERLSRSLASSSLMWLGKVSYGIYIYHMLLKKQFERIASLVMPRLDSNTHLLLTNIIAIVATLLIASLSFYTLEAAFLRLKDRWSHGSPSETKSSRGGA